MRRRDFLYWTLRMFAGLTLLVSSLFSVARLGYSKGRRILLPRDTEPESLIDKDPSSLDTRDLEPVPLENFGTMGPTNHEVDIETWRLEVSGEVEHPLNLTYPELKAMPPLERNVLLICPGFFANHGKWKGLYIQTLLGKAGVKEEATQVTVYGPPASYEKLKRFPMEDVSSDKVFLAYDVNGTPWTFKSQSAKLS